MIYRFSFHKNLQQRFSCAGQVIRLIISCPPADDKFALIPEQFNLNWRKRKKNPTLDPLWVDNYRPISKWPFFIKFG